MDASRFYHSRLREYNSSETDLRSPDDFSIDCMVEFATLMNGQIIKPPMPGNKMTESQVFTYITTQRNWWKGIFAHKQNATSFKARFKTGNVNNYTVTKVFAKFGFHRIDGFESSWVKK